MNFDEKTISENYLYKGKILNLRKDQVELPDGAIAEREVVEHSGGSAVLCEMDGKILLIRQFRYPYKTQTLEIPAGKLNPNEHPSLTAIRELEEEGGIKAGRVEKLFDVYPTPGYTSEVIRIYKAFDLVKTKAKPDDGEFVNAEWYDKTQLEDMIKNGEILDAKTLIALLYALK